MARVDDPALPVGPDEEGGDSLQRALGRREADPLQPLCGLSGRAIGPLRQPLEPLEGERQVRARFDCAIAWISSTITASAEARISLAPEESIR